MNEEVMSNIHILCVDPDNQSRKELVQGVEENLSDLDPILEGHRSVSAAEKSLKNQRVDCIITEYDLPDGSGLELLSRARTVNPDTGGILFTEAGYDTINTDSFETIITEYLDKNLPQAIPRVAQLVRTTVTLQSQTSYPLPRNEQERLATIKKYHLHSPKLRQSLEHLTEMTAHHFDISGVEVNIIKEHRQESIASHGSTSSEKLTPRAESICTFTILEDADVMVVEDVYEDPRFSIKGQEFEERGVRSYMGATLFSSTGLVIGTVCIFTEHLRTFSQEDKNYLRRVAAVAMDLIEAHSRVREQADLPTPEGPVDKEGVK